MASDNHIARLEQIQAERIRTAAEQATRIAEIIADKQREIDNLKAQYADRRSHDAFWMTAEERDRYRPLAVVR